MMLNHLSAEHMAYHEKSDGGDERELHTFALVLSCTNPQCKMSTIATGRLDAYPYYEVTGREYVTIVEPRFFYPPVDVLPIPAVIPEAIRTAVRRSYALFFADPTAAANPLRSAVECFLDITGIPRTNEYGNHQSLHRCLERFQADYPERGADIAELLIAIKWLGNDGSHYGLDLTEEELRKGYEVFLHAMENWFDNPTKRVRGYAAELRRNRCY